MSPKKSNAVTVVLPTLAMLACSSAPPPDPGLPSPSPPQSTSCNDADKNPYGACYPTSDLGTAPRSGAIPGNRIASYAFVGYRATDPTTVVSTSATSTIRFADYYDPDQKLGPNGAGIKIVHLVVSAVWCGPCNEETDLVTGSNYSGTNPGGSSWAKDLAPLGVVFVQALDDGATAGTPATLGDLRTWIANHDSDITSVVDPGNQNLGVFFDAAAIPFNANIDARSMEILSTEVGLNTNGEADIKGWVSWVDAHPPKT